MASAAVSYSTKFPGPYPSLPKIEGYSVETLIKMGWISSEFAKAPAIAEYRRAIESAVFMSYIGGKSVVEPIDSLEQLKAAIYVEWTLGYLQSNSLPTAKGFFSDELWPRIYCPVLVARLFPEHGEPGLNRETYLSYEIDKQTNIVLRLGLLCRSIATNYCDDQVDRFLVALGCAEDVDWVSKVLSYAVLGEITSEAIVKILCEAGVILK